MPSSKKQPLQVVAASLTRQHLRDQICTTANGYPGKPEEYIYSQVCRKKGARPPTAARTGASATRISVASTKIEIDLLKAALVEYSPNEKPKAIAGNYIKLTGAVFRTMIKKEERIRRPDPIARYTSIVSGLHQNVPGVKTQRLPRQVILTMVMDHLIAMTR